MPAIASLEETYKSNLDENLEESRKKDLTVITPFMQNEWVGFEQVSDEGMLKKYDTTFDQNQLTAIAKTICELPSDKKFISKNIV